MPTHPRLSEADITHCLAGLAGWRRDGQHIEKIFRFSDFASAFGFMAACAIVAESMQHHPDWSNIYNKVVVRLSTHDAGGLTELDFTLAHKMDALACGDDRPVRRAGTALRPRTAPTRSRSARTRPAGRW